MALAEANHHTARQKTARAEATYYTSKTSVAGDTAFFSLFDEEDDVWSTRTNGLVEPQGPQARVQRHAVEQMIESFVPVPMLDLDAPVPQTVDQLVDVLKLFDNSVPEQVIDVPKISQDASPQRTVLFEPQLAEQLVEVPTVPFSSSRPFTLQCRRTCCSLPLMDTSGAGSWGPLGCISGGLAPSTPSGDPRRDTPPAQGGIEILGTAALVDVVCGGAHAACISSSTDWWFQLFLRQVPTLLSVRPWRLHWCSSWIG